MFYALIYDQTTGAGIGSHAYVEKPSVLPADQVACTQAQASLPASWKVSGGSLVAAPASLAEQAAAALSAGLAITSTSTPTLDGTYPLTDAMQANLVALEGYYQKFSTFPNGAATVSLKDTGGAVHSFTYTQFEALFQKLGDVRAALIDCVDGISTTLPPTSATIA